MSEQKLKPAYKLGIYYTDIWSLDISSEIEPVDIALIPPVPCVSEQRIVVSTAAPVFNKGSIPLFIAFAHSLNELYISQELLQNNPLPGQHLFGPKIIILFTVQAGEVIITTIRPLQGIGYEGKWITPDLYPEFFASPGVSRYYTYRATVAVDDTEHPFYGLVHPTVKGGTQLLFNLAMR